MPTSSSLAAVLSGARDRMKDSDPDSFLFHEYDVKAKSSILLDMRPIGASVLFTPRTITYNKFSWGWRLTATSQVTCTLVVSPEIVVDDGSEISIWVRSDQFEWRYNDKRAGHEFDVDSVGSLYPVSYRKDKRKQPKGLMTLLDAALKRTSAA